MSRDPLAGVNILDYVDDYDVKFVDPKLMDGNIIALNELTTLGRKYRFKSNEIWISKKVKKYAPILIVHEIDEHMLRQMGWLYKPSHEHALKAEKKYFGGTDLYDEYMREVQGK